MVSAFVTGWLFKSMLSGGTAIYPAIIAASVFVALSSLNTLLKKDFGHRAIVIALEALVFTLIFWGLSAGLLGAVFLVMFGMLLWGAFTGRAEMENSLEIKFFRITQKPLSRTITALSVVAILLYVPQWQTRTEFISEKAFDSMFAASRNVAGRLYPEFDFNSDMNALAESLAETKLNENADYKLLPPAVKEATVKRTSVEVVKSLSQSLGLDLTGAENISTVIYKYLMKLLDDWRVKLGDSFIVLWAIAVFLFIRGIGTLLGYLVAFLTYVVYHFLLVTNMIKLDSELQPQETVDFR